MVRRYLEKRITESVIIATNKTTDYSGKSFSSRQIAIRTEMLLRDFLIGRGGDERWISLIGLRGVGKSTILAQSYLYLINNGVQADDIVYVSVDQLQVQGFDLMGVVNAFEEIKGVSLDALTDKTFFLIDETQEQENWARVLKTLHDRNKNIFIFSTGSSALQLQADADVTRRTTPEKLYPLNFAEYNLIRNGRYPIAKLKSRLRQALYQSQSASECYARVLELQSEVDSYWEGTDETTEVPTYLMSGMFPFVVNHKNPELCFDRIREVVDKVAESDISAIRRFDPETIKKVPAVLVYLCDKDVLSVNKTSRDLGMNAITLDALLKALEESELLIKVPPVGSSTSKVKKPSKFLFMSPNIRAALIRTYSIKSDPMELKGHLLEDLVALHLYRDFVGRGTGRVTYDTKAHHADFILQLANGNKIAIEVGHDKRSVEQALNTVEDRKCMYGITYNSTRLSICSNEKVVSIPHKYLLLV